MKINPDVYDCFPAPIAEAWSWIKNPDDPELIDVCQAVPAYLPHPSMLDFMADEIRSGHAATYTDIQGILPLREALSVDINQRYRGSVSPEEIVITAGCNQGFCTVIDTLCQSGDNVIVPLPCYFNHEMWLSIRGVEPRWLDFNEQTAEPDPAQVAELVDNRTRAIVLVTPNNPTGSIYSSDTIYQFFEIARQHDIPLIIDETYRDFMDDSEPPHTLFQQPGWQDTFIHLYSFSKAFSLTGHRVGAIVGGKELVFQACKIQDCVAINAPHLGQVAAQFGLENLSEWKRQNGRIMMERATAVKTAFKNPELEYRVVCAGAYFAYIKHPFDVSSRKVAECLASEFNVVCLPGQYFGKNQDNFFRLAFSNLPEDRIPTLVSRLISSQALLCSSQQP